MALDGVAVCCTGCGHPEKDHGPESGRWKSNENGEWDEIIPGRLCYYMENQGYQQDLCCCPGFNQTGEDAPLVSVMGKAGLR